MLLAMLYLMPLVAMTSRAMAQPARCCFENVFTAILGEVGGRVNLGHLNTVEGTVAVAYDFYNKRLGTVARTLTDGTQATVFTLYDFANRMVYISAAGGLCTSHRMTDSSQMHPSCVPADAQFLGSARFGYGSEVMVINSWEYRQGGTDVMVKIAMTEDCVPVFQAFYGHVSEVNTELTYFYTSYHPGIEDHDALNPPTGCHFVPEKNMTAELPIGRRHIPVL